MVLVLRVSIAGSKMDVNNLVNSYGAKFIQICIVFIFLDFLVKYMHIHV